MRIGREKEQARERDRDRERKKRGNRKYGQAKLRHSRKGILSLMMAAVVAGIFIALILTALLNKGSSGAIIGSFGLFDILLAITGIICGVKGFRERDKNYFTCKMGIGINVFILLCLIAVFVRGLV
ncbi:MAG: DUF6142 family protein [Bariatricus sp.]|nr:DUF6142 family protein [Bariatricus sp.]